MTEILTESFCERCGTRYTFETARPRNSRLGRARTFTKGVRNFVLSDDPFSVAMAEARGEEERNATALQLDAFHKTFNFCMSCRQYTCSTCWNVEDGRCLSCAPRPGSELVEEVGGPEDAAVTARLAALAEPEAPVHESIGIASWPEADLAQRPAPEAADAVVETVVEAAPAPDVTAAAAEVRAEPEPGVEIAGEHEVVAERVIAEPPVEAEAVAAAVVAGIDVVEGEPVAPEAELVATAEVEVAAVDQAEAVAEAEGRSNQAEVVAEPEVGRVEHETLPAPEAEAELVRPAAIQGLKPGESLDDAIAAYEAALAETGDAAAAASLAVEPEFVVAPEAEPVLLEAAVELEPVASAAVEPEAVVAPEPEPVVEAVVAEAVAFETAEPEVALQPEGVAVAEAVAVETSEPVAVVPEPEPDIAAEAVEPEAVAAEPEPVAEAVPEPGIAVEPEPGIAVEPESVLAAAVAAPVPEPIAPAPAPIPEPEPIAAVAAPAPEPVATAPVAQPPTPAPAPMAPGWLTVAPDDGSAPVWPQQVSWPGDRQPSDRMFAGRRMLPTGNAASVWAASAREVLEAGPLPGAGNVNSAAASPGAQPCIGCGLPLSANARFCRRCGARQG